MYTYCERNDKANEKGKIAQEKSSKTNNIQRKEKHEH